MLKIKEKRTMAKFMLLAVTISFLTGCASLNSEFNCPAKKGLGCKSIEEINQKVNDGVLGDTSLKTSNTSNIVTTPKHANTPSLFSHYYPNKPGRTRDKVLSIWIAPYVDNKGNFHDASTVHTVVKPSDWLARSGQ